MRKAHFNGSGSLLTAHRYLGHTAPTTTMRIYTHLAEETELKDAEKVRMAFR